jgi:hypothetical protein
MRTILAALTTVAFLGLGCSATSSPDDASPASVTQTIGPEGGVIVAGGATVTFPKGALAESKAITIRATDVVPEGFVLASRVFQCEPSGTSFAQPVTMKMPFTDDGAGALTMFWSTGADPTFKDIGGTVDGPTMTATVNHFSSGFVGRRK